MKIAIVTFDGFNEIDSFVALNLLNRVKREGWEARLATPTPCVTSMNGVQVQGHWSLEEASEADVVLVGSGNRSRQVAENPEMLSRLKLDPERQLIGSQCSGALILQALGLLEGRGVCTDRATRPVLEAQGVRLLNIPFYSKGQLATAGGCLSAVYLASWVIMKLLGSEELALALGYISPVGEEQDTLERVLHDIRCCVPL